VLRRVLATSGADVSASRTRTHERAAATSVGRLDAEGAAIQQSRRHQRYTELLLAAGVLPEHIEAAKAADRWRPMLERMREAEQLGLDLSGALNSAAHRKGERGQLLARVDAGLGEWIDRDEGSGGRRTWAGLDGTPTSRLGPVRDMQG